MFFNIKHLSHPNQQHDESQKKHRPIDKLASLTCNRHNALNPCASFVQNWVLQFKKKNGHVVFSFQSMGLSNGASQFTHLEALWGPTKWNYFLFISKTLTPETIPIIYYKSVTLCCLVWFFAYGLFWINIPHTAVLESSYCISQVACPLQQIVQTPPASCGFRPALDPHFGK